MILTETQLARPFKTHTGLDKGALLIPYHILVRRAAGEQYRLTTG